MIVSAALDGAHAMAAFQDGFLSSVRPTTATETIFIPSTWSCQCMGRPRSSCCVTGLPASLTCCILSAAAMPAMHLRCDRSEQPADGVLV